MSESMRGRIVLAAMVLGMAVAVNSTPCRASGEIGRGEKVELADVREDVNAALQSIKQYSIDKKEEGVVEAKKLLDKMDARIEQLEERSREEWQRMSKASREKSREELRELRKKRNEIAEWYGGMKQSSAQAWEVVKQGFVDSFHSLQRAFDKAAEEF